MTCEECQEILLDADNRASRKSWVLGVSVLNLAKQHAENCPACACKMAEISSINDGLDQLRLSALQIEVSPAIETNLLFEFRRRRALRAPSVSNSFRWRLLCGSAIALVLVATLVFYAARRTRSSGTGQTAWTERAIKPPQPLDSGPSFDPALIENNNASSGFPKSANSKREFRIKQRKRGQERVWKESALSARDEFSLNGGGNVVRVTLPRASLVAMGVPMYPDVSDRPVTADVARDPFGAIIAIHLVQMKPSTN